MLASTTGSPVAAAGATGTMGARGLAGAKHRRRIGEQAGRALEILGHAIGYLADEYAHRGGSLSSEDGEVQAIQLLMARNREIYLACPVVPTLWERCRGWLMRRAA